MSETQQQFIQGILNQVYPILNNSESSNQFYVPRYVVNNHLDPYKPPQGSTWPISNMNNPAILQEIPAVCTDIQNNATTDPCSNQNDNYNAVPNRGPDVVLSNIVVNGASNAYVQSATATSSDGYTIDIVILFSTLSDPQYPKPIRVTGDFKLTLYCCCGSGQTGCNDPNTTGNPEVGSGNFTVQINNSKATATLQITDLHESTLNLKVSNLVYTAANSDITITPTIKSIPGNSKAYNNLVAEAFGADSTKEFVLNAVNQQLTAPNALNEMGTWIQKELDSYLQSTHQYPFDQASSAAF